jgi:glycerol-3-phosphate acyltransferase PlsY
MMQTILIAVLTAAQAYLLGSVDTGEVGAKDV